MTLEVHIPSRESPPLWRLALVVAIAFAVGMSLAAWGTTDERDGGRAGGAAVLRPEGAEREPEADGSGDIGATIMDAGVEPYETARVVEERPGAETPDDEATAAASEDAGSVRATPEAPPPNAQPSPPPTPSAGPLALRRGRVAYLRCAAGSGPACPRDEALEASIWTAIDSLPRCASPPLAAGEGDVRLDYRGDGAPEVAWRDTFSDDVVRLDRDRVMGCLGAALASTRQTTPTERLLVSFRFRLE